MKGPHTAENVLVAIKEILDKFQFNKSKIAAIVCDEGSNLVRLFGAINSENSFYLNHIDKDKDDPNDHDYEPSQLDESSDDDDDNEDDNDDDNNDDGDDADENESNLTVEQSMSLENLQNNLYKNKQL